MNTRNTIVAWWPLLVMALIFLYASSAAQAPRDTSFTPYSAYIKERKKFPNIEIVHPAKTNPKRWKKDIVYSTIKDTPYGKRELHLDLFLPQNKSGKRPAVIMLHGGGWSSGSKAHMFSMAQKFSDQGYVAVAVEYRLSDEARFPAAVIDVKNAIRWLRSRYRELKLDTNKIAILGCSAGAQLAALTAMSDGVKELDDPSAKSSAKVNAIVSMDGIVSFIHPEAEAEGQAASKWLDGTRHTNYENWKRASPMEYLSSKTPPIGFINSSIPRFHAGRDDLIKKMSELGIYTEVHTIPDTPHPFWLFHPWFETAFNYALSYLDNVFDRK